MDFKNEAVRDCALLAVAADKCALVFRDVGTSKLVYVGKYHPIVDFGLGRVRIDRVPFDLEGVVSRINALDTPFDELKVLRARVTTADVLPEAFRDVCDHMQTVRKIEMADNRDRTHENSGFAVTNPRNIEMTDAEAVAVLSLPTEPKADFQVSAAAKLKKQFEREASVNSGARELLKDSEISVEAQMTRSPPYVWKKNVVVRVGNASKRFSSYRKAIEYFSEKSNDARTKRKFDDGAADSSETDSLDKAPGGKALGKAMTLANLNLPPETIAQLDAIAAAAAAATVPPAPAPAPDPVAAAVPMLVSVPTSGESALKVVGRLAKEARVFVMDNELFDVDAEAMDSLRRAYDADAGVLQTLGKIMDLCPPAKRVKVFVGAVKAFAD